MAEHNFLDMPCGIMDQFVTSMAVPGDETTFFFVVNHIRARVSHRSCIPSTIYFIIYPEVYICIYIIYQGIYFLFSGVHTVEYCTTMGLFLVSFDCK